MNRAGELTWRKTDGRSAAARTTRIACRGHPLAMDSLIIMLVVVVGLCVVAPFAGVDSRAVSNRDRRGWWP